MGANVSEIAGGDGFVVFPNSDRAGPSFVVKTIHISCKSDPYLGSKHKYGGIIIYGRNGQADWRTANGTHCKSGYLVIKQTDTREFTNVQNNVHERGKVHGTIYRTAFGESVDDANVNVVGEGFAIIDGEFKIKSGALNPAHGDSYHNEELIMHKDSARYVKAVVDNWKREGTDFLKKQNYSLKDLLD